MNSYGILLMALLTFSLSDGEKILIDKTILEVEKEAITLKDLEIHSKIQVVILESPESLYKIKDPGFITSMINLLLNRELVSLELKKEKKFKPHIYNRQAENLFVKIRGKFKDNKAFEEFLSDINMNEGELKRTLAIYFMIDDYIDKLAEEKIKIDEEELNKYILSLGINPPFDGETLNKYKNELKMEKKKNFAANYLEELKNRYRIRYLYIPQ
jgi:hypothetical protein